MSIYRTLSEWSTRYVPAYFVLKHGLNWSPMYRRSTGKIIAVSKDLRDIRIRLPLNWRNRNYMNTMFGGSMFSAVDPIPMTQLIYLIGNDYVVWDKSAEIFFRRPAKGTLYADFRYSLRELDSIRERVAEENEIEIVKFTELTDQNRTKVFCEVRKTLYIADRTFYLNKRRKNQTRD